jgi:hypothetical protein
MTVQERKQKQYGRFKPLYPISEILDFVKNGASTSDVVSRYGCSDAFVSRCRRQVGIPPIHNNPSNAELAFRVEKVLEMRKTMKLREIAIHFGISARRVCDIISPQKEKARQAAKHARRKGLLCPEPCSLCGEVQSQMHHTDYSKPLEVVWLCRKCHIKQHYP